MLEVRDLSLRYGQSEVLHGVDLDAVAGSVTAVMGMNGVGKTSLMKAIAGRHPFTGGRIVLEGRDLGHPTAARAARAGIAYVPQGREIFPRLTVTENIESGFACLPRGGRRVPDRIYDLFPVLAEMRHRRGGDLSGGQQQQLAIARALVTRPKVLLLDEPTEGIQPSIIKDIGRVIATLRAEGEMAIVLVEQFFDFAVAAADRFVALKSGEVVLREEAEGVDRARLLAEISL
ncbi:urea ABC transporter ATP-binding subunit UrtE [Pseudoroseicyclus aestuarii]|uniref:Amino acid/amide ABC transporter ATP-binding protein 2 (HAAT family) n=1 Tax=Pseudoroseicyclus aestuarii TaxID=1795041 RepID=A0A318STH9_9RHOB|nr:urea ABC transporter ATP-binding subunit UrtE [Pseudoroseicyclus aestuarii]PYE84953.1 amino acid/amide ABC transporter ATP-binding protein 2 (HAAT family) [Pseudoroseicyclus aestuarii]